MKSPIAINDISVKFGDKAILDHLSYEFESGKNYLFDWTFWSLVSQRLSRPLLECKNWILAMLRFLKEKFLTEKY